MLSVHSSLSTFRAAEPRAVPFAGSWPEVPQLPLPDPSPRLSVHESTLKDRRTPRSTVPIDARPRTSSLRLAGQRRELAPFIGSSAGEPHGLYILCQAQEAETWRGLARDTDQFIIVPVSPVHQVCQCCSVPALHCFNLTVFECPYMQEGLLSLSSKPSPLQQCHCRSPPPEA